MSAATLTPLAGVDRHHPTTIHALVAAAQAGTDRGITLLPERAGGPEVYRSYRDLLAAAALLELRLQDRGVRPGDRVLLVFPTSHEFIVAFFAVQLLGAVPIPSYPPDALRLEAGLARLAHIAERAGVRAVLTSPALRAVGGDIALRARGVRLVDVVEGVDEAPSWMEDGNRFGEWAEPAVGPDHTSFLQFTSGSTGKPRGVILSHGNITANTRAIGEGLGVTADDVVVGWLPLYHDMGLIGTLLFAVHWRLPLVLMSPTAFLRQPSRWLTTIHRFRGTLSPAPNFAYDLCVKRPPKPGSGTLDLSSWRLALNGAEPVNPGTLEAFQAVYGPHGFRAEAAYPVYGLAEASLAVTFPEPGAPVRTETLDREALGEGQAEPVGHGKDGIRVVSVGRAVPRHEVQVVDARGRPVPERVVGEVTVRGPSVMQGYAADPEGTRHALRGEWLHTGDLGYLAGGDLFIVGRKKDLLIVRGRNIHPEDVERTAEGVSGVRAGGTAAFAVPGDHGEERTVLVCEARTASGREADLVDRIRQAVAEAHDFLPDAVVLVASGTIPRTFSGKRQRSLCRDLYLKEKLAPARSTRWAARRVALRGALGLAMARLRGGTG
jgi:acyl-CoA synthetase (AMP-forming)/AMP-acid ligase II